ncbi:MAG: dTMP kinase, partial [Chloroflexi bacterium]|nr:dTMP kinase [Chloroflexota bacterium]
VVICDRYADSTIAYQSYGRGLDLALVRTINNTATGGLTPALTILLDMPVEESLARKEGKRHDRFEQEAIAFHQKVRNGYLKLAASEPKRWLVIDGRQSRDRVKEVIWEKVSHLLSGVIR